MAIIKLTRGFSAIVDDSDYEWLSSYSWYASGHEGRPARRMKDGEAYPRQLIYMYHQILGVYPQELKGLEVDHEDRNPLNNTRKNIRLVTHTVNMQNSITSINRRGVCFDIRHSKWKAYLDRHNKNRINLGTFKTEQEAITAVAQARSQYP